MKKPVVPNIEEYKRQMESGNIPKTYKALIGYIMGLRNYLKNNYPDYVVGSFYQGYMDMTYFPIATSLLKEKKLKLAIVFDHLKTQFEIWLSGQNRAVQKEYVNLLKDKKLGKDYLFTENPDSIVEILAIESPDFKDLDKITAELETKIEQFIVDVTAIF